MNNPWQYRAVCDCGWHTHCPGGDNFFVLYDLCPVCGSYKDEWVVRRMRYVSDVVWYKPSTWFSNHWETYDG